MCSIIIIIISNSSSSSSSSSNSSSSSSSSSSSRLYNLNYMSKQWIILYVLVRIDGSDKKNARSIIEVLHY